MAVQVTRETRPDVVLTDVNMPLIGGVEVTRTIKQEYPTIAVVGLSMYDHTVTMDAMRHAGAADYVLKGSSFETICGAIREAAAKEKGRQAW